MKAPPAELIETAVDEMPNVPEFIIKAQRKELEEAMGEKPEEFQKGYELGLQTARVVLSRSVVPGASEIL